MKELKEYQKAVNNLRESLGVKDNRPFDDLTNCFYTELLYDNEIFWANSEKDMENEECYSLEFYEKVESEHLIAFRDKETYNYVLFKKENELK